MSCFCAGAQVLDNSEGNAFTDKPFFNKEFIRNNKIKSINGRFNYKKSGQAIYTTDFFYVYSFDDEGNLTSTFETRTDDGTADTTWNRYEYDQQGRIRFYKRGDKSGYTTIGYEYDEQGRVIAQEQWTESFDSLGNREKAILQNRETMRYEVYDRQEKKTVLNSYDLPYMTELSYYDENGYLMEREERLIMTSAISKVTYSYNERGLLAELSTLKKGSGDIPSEAWKFKYDEFGNLSQKHIYRNGEFITDIQILYNEKSRLMTAVLIRDVKTDFIMIIRFMDYTYYE